MEKGLIHVYTGDGKGKSTAALGLALRACGASKKVCIVQFLKSADSSELKSIERLKPDIELFRFEKTRDFVWNLSESQKLELKAEVRQAFDFAVSLMQNGSCDLLILDEIMGAISNGFISSEELRENLLRKHNLIEVVLTGRNVPSNVIEIADYVSEIKCIKHPYEKGVCARKGIEY